MKKLLLGLVVLAATNSFAGELPYFHDVASAVSQGKTIHIVANSSKCTPANKIAPDVWLSIFTPQSIMLSNSVLAASLMHFTLEDPQYPNQPVYEYVGYVLKSDNSLDLSYQILDTKTYAPLGGKMTVNCKMGDGVKVYG